jgi:hypothetical protein
MFNLLATGNLSDFVLAGEEKLDPGLRGSACGPAGSINAAVAEDGFESLVFGKVPVLH